MAQKKTKTFWSQVGRASWLSNFARWCTPTFFWKLLLEPSHSSILMIILVLGELILNMWIIQRVKYTEIDWKAYMQEVEGFLNGTLDYRHLMGDTGPLVYPAGFVYIYTALYKLTYAGQCIRLAQYIFALLYLLNLVLVFNIYRKCGPFPSVIFAFMCVTSYRVHSIFVLRLFNDTVAVTIFHVALNLFIAHHWFIGCFVFSLAVSVKMNILLYAPALLFILLASQPLVSVMYSLTICAMTQLVLGFPFLMENPKSYILGAFNLGRVFLFKWTVNWRFVPEDIFVSRVFHFLLLCLHILVLISFCTFRWMPHYKKAFQDNSTWLKPYQITFLLFTSNFIGMCFSRSLHYQFYVWYYYSLPFLLWTVSLSNSMRFLLWGLAELCWNIYPSTNESSAVLQACHVVLLLCLFRIQGIPGGVCVTHAQNDAEVASGDKVTMEKHS